MAPARGHGGDRRPGRGHRRPRCAGTATFYDMLHTEPVGTYVVSLCTNIACLLGGALELLEHAEERLGVAGRGDHGRRRGHPRGGRVPGRLRQGAVRPGEPPLRLGPDPRGLRPPGRGPAGRPAGRRRARARDAGAGAPLGRARGRPPSGWPPSGRPARRGAARPGRGPRRDGHRRPPHRHVAPGPRRLAHPRALPGHRRLRGAAQGPHHDARGGGRRGRRGQPAGPRRGRLPGRAASGRCCARTR